MAGGAKYWQIRWERATRTLEIYLLEQLKDEKTVFQFFTSDGGYLSKDETFYLENVNLTSVRAKDRLLLEKGYVYKRAFLFLLDTNRKQLYFNGKKYYFPEISFILS